MTDTPETDKAVGKWDPIPGVCANFARKLERERNAAIAERNNALSDWRQADTDSIRALYERNEARKERDVAIYERDRLLENLELALNATVLNHRNEAWHRDAEHTLKLINQND